MENGLTASDIALLGNNGGNCMNGMGGAFWIFALLILAGGGFGGFGNNNGNANAIQADINRGFDNQNLQAQTRDILNSVNVGTSEIIAASTANATNAINAIKDGNVNLIREFGTVETALTALSGKQSECCCQIKQLISETTSALGSQLANAKYETAMQIAGVEQRLAAKMDANTIQQLRDQVNALQINQAVAGVVRYPMSSTYSSGTNPFCGCGMCA